VFFANQPSLTNQRQAALVSPDVDDRFEPICRVFSFDEWEYGDKELEKPVATSEMTDSLIGLQKLCSNDCPEPRQITLSHSKDSAFQRFDLTTLDTSGTSTEKYCSTSTSSDNDGPWCEGIQRHSSNYSFESDSMDLSTPSDESSIPGFVYVVKKESRPQNIFRNLDETLESLTRIVSEDLETIQLYEV
jgi:hypothetical protein